MNDGRGGNDSFERSLKKFNKKCVQAGLLKEIKKHQFFEKPSVKKKRKLNDAIRRYKKAAVLDAL